MPSSGAHTYKHCQKPQPVLHLLTEMKHPGFLATGDFFTFSKMVVKLFKDKSFLTEIKTKDIDNLSLYLTNETP